MALRHTAAMGKQKRLREAYTSHCESSCRPILVVRLSVTCRVAAAVYLQIEQHDTLVMPTWYVNENRFHAHSWLAKGLHTPAQHNTNFHASTTSLFLRQRYRYGRIRPPSTWVI